VASVYAASSLVVNPSQLGPFYLSPGGNGSVQTVEAFNAGTGDFNVTASTSASWLVATTGALRACTIKQSGNCVPVSIALNTSGLTPGSYTEYLTVTVPGAVDSPLQIPVTVVIASVPTAATLYSTPFGKTSFNIYPSNQINIAMATTTAGSWLSFQAPLTSPSFTFGTPYTINATPQPGMAAGTYSGTVTVTGSSNANDNQAIAVTLVVTDNPIIQVNNSALLMNGAQGGPKVSVPVTLVNIGEGNLSVSNASVTSSTAGFLGATADNTNSVVITADPGQLTPGLYTGTVSVTSNAANSTQVAIPVEFTVTASGQPTISQGGIVNIATFLADSIPQGGIAAIFGDQFSATGSFYTNTTAPPLARQLGNVQVLVNGAAAPLYYVSRQQINFQMPYDIQAGQSTTVQVVSNNVSGNIRSVQITSAAPRILVWPSNVAQGSYGIIVNSDGSVSLPTTAGVQAFQSRPSKPLETITIYCIGLGQTNPGAISGAPATAVPLEQVSGISVSVGSLPAVSTITPVFAGLTPTAVGLYQVNVTLPNNVPIGGSVPISLNANNVTASNIANIAISAQ
jgi:uncharacterized protein (TIGR03437 family)